MTRQNIFEILHSKYNIEKEFDKINKLFDECTCVYINPLNFIQYTFTIEGLVDEFLLFHWKHRGSYLSCEEMRCDIGFDTSNCSVNNILTTLEYYINIINLFYIKVLPQNRINYRFGKEFNVLMRNIEILLEYLNYNILRIDEEEKSLLVPKNPAATSVAEISSRETGLAILKYHHASLKGDLVGKRNLLNTIYLEYETVLDNPNENYRDFYKKATQLYNNLHIRHNNKTKENNKNTIIEIDDAKLEEYYDELYQLLLFCILIKDNLERKNRIDNFLKTLKKES